MEEGGKKKREGEKENELVQKYGRYQERLPDLLPYYTRGKTGREVEEGGGGGEDKQQQQDQTQGGRADWASHLCLARGPNARRARHLWQRRLQPLSERH